MQRTMAYFVNVNTILSILVASWLTAANASPTSLSYQGRIVKPDGSVLTYDQVGFIFKVYSSSGTCLLYQEQVNGYDMSASNGVFDIPIGKGTVVYPNDGSLNILDVFNNSTTFTCSGGAIYTPTSGAERILRVMFYDGSGWQTITPDNVIRSVPFAGYAAASERLGTHTASEFLLKTGLPTCASGSYLTYNGVSLSCAPVSPGNSGTITSITAGAGLTGGTITSSGTIALATSGATSGSYGSSTQVPVISVDTFGRITSAASTTISGVTPGGTASGDLGGNYPNPTVNGLSGTSLVISSLANGQFLKYNGASWVNSTLSTSDISGLSSAYLTQSAFNTYVSSGNCSVSQTMYWNSVSGTFQCQAINVGLAGDVTGTIGAAKVVALQNSPVDTIAPILNQVLQWNGSKWTPVTLPSGNAGTVTAVSSANSDLSVASGTTTPVLTLNSGTGANQIVKLDGAAKLPAIDGSQLTNLQVSQIPNLSATKITSGVLAVPQGGTGQSTFSDGQLLIGDSSTNGLSKATLTAGSGVSIINGNGSITIAATGSGGTITDLTGDVSATGTGSVVATVNSVGGSTAANIHSAELLANGATNANTASTIVKRDASGNFNAGTITASLTGAASLNVLKSGDSMTGNLTFGSTNGLVFTDSGSSTVGLQAPTTISTNYVLKLPTAQGSANQLMANDGSGNLFWTSLSSLGVASVSVTSPITNTGTASAPNIGIQVANTSQSGYLSSADWNAFNSKQSTALASANIWVGNGSNIATAVAPSGDITITNAGAFSVTKIQGTAVSSTTPSASGQVLRYNGTTQYAPAFLGVADIKSTITPFGGAFAAANCSATQSLYYSSASDTFLCQTVTASATSLSGIVPVANGGTGAATASQGAVFVGPANGSGAPSFRAIASTDLPTTLGTNDANVLGFKTNNSIRVTIDATGKVGIGTATPSALLDVSGDAKINGITVGLGSGGVSGNLAVGDSALISNTSGQFNIAMGYWALNQNTTGQYNTGVGFGSLYPNVDGSFNTALGTTTLSSNVSGSYLTAVGNSALLANTTGSYNTAIGTNALNANVASNYNTAVGYQAGVDYNNASSVNGNNTFIGSNAGRGIATGVNNTIIGANVQGLSATLSNNVILADGSGNIRLNVDSNGNTGIGTTTPTKKLDVAGTVKLGTAGTGFTAMGTCSFTQAVTTSDTTATCTGVPASTSVVVSCSPTAALSAATGVVFRANGSLNTIALRGTVAATSATWNCMWMQP